MTIVVPVSSLFSRPTLLTCIKHERLAQVQHLRDRVQRKQHGKKTAADSRSAEQNCPNTGFNVTRTEASSFLPFTRRRFHGAPRR